MAVPSFFLAVALASSLAAPEAVRVTEESATDDASATSESATSDSAASDAGATSESAAGDESATGESATLAANRVSVAPGASRAGATRATRERTGRGMLIAGGVLTGLGVVGRIGLEVFWSTAAQIVPTDPFARWSTANVVFLTNWNNLMFFGPGLGLLTAGAYRRGGYAARHGELRDARRMRLVGIGMLSGGLGLWALSRALFLPIADACPSNRCAYTTLETTFWIGAGAIFAGAAHLAYATGYSRARVSVAPSFGPGLAGLGVTGRF